jgi:DNA-binding SARP family transcriptional activator
MIVEVPADEVTRALRDFAGSDSRPGFGAFHDDRDEGDEVDEFADEPLFVESHDEGSPLDAGGVIEVNVIGPVEVTGWLTPPSRRVITELACYLALHPNRAVSAEELRAALRRDSAEVELSAKTLRNNISELRRLLGPEIVPLAGANGYRLSGRVRSDWTTFQDLVEQAGASAAAHEASRLRTALTLVRGRPFADVDYPWVLREFLFSEMEVAIGAAARRLAALSLEANDLAGALFALRRGLLASPYDLELWEEALRAAVGLGAGELTRTWRDAQATLGADARELTPLVDRLRRH